MRAAGFGITSCRALEAEKAIKGFVAKDWVRENVDMMRIAYAGNE
jgi:hypothetical protein